MELVESMDFGTSAQVLQEFFVTVVKKGSRPISAAQALAWIELRMAFPCQTIDHQLVRIAIEHPSDSRSLIGTRLFWRLPKRSAPTRSTRKI